MKKMVILYGKRMLRWSDYLRETAVKAGRERVRRLPLLQPAPRGHRTAK